MNIPRHAPAAVLALLLGIHWAPPAQAASTCLGFIPPTITTASHLMTAVNQAQSGSCPGADTIDLAGNTITFAAAGFSDGGDNLALPAITTPLSIINGTITRSSASGFRFLLVSTGGDLTLDNMTLSNGGGVGTSDGGAMRVGGTGNLLVANSTFLNNTAPDYGGGAILGNGSGTITVRDSQFRGNVAGANGGAINIQNASLTVDRSRFEGNTSGGDGGAIEIDSSLPAVLRDSLVVGNNASMAVLNRSNLTIINTTLAGNMGHALSTSPGGTTTIRNSVIWGNDLDGVSGDAPAALTFTAAANYPGATINAGYASEDFFVDPLTNPTAANTGANYNPAVRDWRLRPFSPAIDAAQNTYASTSDASGGTRRINDTNVADTGSGTAPIVDMGAYERQAASCSTFTSPYTLIGSSNAVRRLNLRDAVRCANLNGASPDIIDLDGQTVTFASAFANATALPEIDSVITLRNGVIERSPVAGTPKFRLLINRLTASLTLADMTLRNGDMGNMLNQNAGAIMNHGVLTIQESSLYNNTAYNSAALFNNVGATATISRSTLRDNTSVDYGSAAANFGTLSLINSTVTDNSNTGSGNGTLFTSPGSTTTLINSTVSGNSSVQMNSAALYLQGATNIRNTILANNLPFDCARFSGAFTFSPALSNIIEIQNPDYPCGTVGSTHLAVDPQLGALTGSPAHFPLTASSPAINAGNNASTGGATVDQPGNVRTQNGVVDLGSVESSFAPQITLQFNAATSSASEAAGFGNLLRVTTSDGNVTPAAATVTVNVTGGTASAADYTRTGTITVPAGTPNNALVSIASGITVTNDSVAEANETIMLSLAAPGGAVLGTQTTTTHTITNDDIATVTIADVTQAEGNSGTGTMTFTVTLDNPVQGGFLLDFATANLTATTADADYAAASGSLTFSGMAGETQTINVAINGDTKLEGNETFRVLFPSALSSVAPGALIITDTAIGTIINDDAAAVTIADVSLIEGNAGVQSMTFTATLNNAVQGGFTVNYATANGTATTADNDYVAATGTLNFTGPAGQSRTFTVPINGDTRVEADETLTVSLNTISNASVLITDTAIGTILNDDSAAVTISDVTQSENGTFTFTATLSNTTSAAFSVDWALAAGTTSAADYVGGVLPTGGTLNFSGTTGQTRTFTVPVLNDTLVEGTETFTVSMTNFITSGGFVVNTADTAIGTILDNDAASVTISDITQPENGTFTFTATLSNATSAAFSVDWALAAGTTSAADYVGGVLPTGGTLNFSGNTGETRTFTVPVLDDTLVEGPETFTVSLTNFITSGGFVVNTTDTATGTILDNDVAAITLSDASVVEGNSGTAILRFNATLNNAVSGGFTVNYATANGTATAGSDYVAATGTLTFVGNANEVRTVDVVVNGDLIVEPDETLTLSLNTVSNAAVTITDTAVGTIENDDSATLSLTNVAQAEGNGGSSLMIFTATLDRAVAGGFIVNYSTSDGTATVADLDYLADAGALVFVGTAGETRAFSIRVNSDERFEADETFSISLSNVTVPDVDISAIATGTILNDDAPAGVIVAPLTITTTEAGGSDTFTVVLASAPNAPVVIDVASSNLGEGTVSPSTYTFTPGNWNLPATFTVTGVDDNVADGDVAYTIAIAPIASTDPNFNGIDPADVAATNLDDDTLGILVTPTTLAIAEGGADESYTIVLQSEPTGPVTVAITDDAQVQAAPASVMFSPANWNTAQAITVTAIDDAIMEGNHSGTITHTASGADYAGVAAASVSVAISDNDSAGIVVTPTAGLVTTEAGGSATFTVVLSSQPTADVTMALSSSDGSEGTVAPAALIFGAANWNIAQTVTVTGVDDAVVDGDVAYTIAIAPIASTDPNFNGINPDDVAAVNTDDDTRGVTVTPTSLAVSEGGAGDSYTIVLQSEPTGPVSIAITADTQVTASPASLAFTSGNWATPQTVIVAAVDDTTAEGNHTGTITHAASGADYAGAPVASVGVDISDNDATGILVAPTAGLVTTEAGGSASFTLVLASAPTADVTIALSSSNTSEGTVAPAAVTFDGTTWNLPQTVTVTGVDDAVLDGDIAYTIVTGAAISADPGYAGLDADDVAVTNSDDDTASLRVDDAALAEGDSGTTAFVFSVTLEGAVDGGVTVAYATAENTATAPADYVANTGSLSFDGNDGETRTITVQVNGDTVVEGEESFRVVLSTPVPAVVTLARAEAIGTIQEDDAAASLSASKRIVQAGTRTQPVVYEIVLTNTGAGDQGDDPASDELVDVLPAALALTNATASAGTLVADIATNTVRWNGALAAGASVTLQIEADVVATAAGPISNQAQVTYDTDGDGSNDAVAVSDDPSTPGADATVFVFEGSAVPAPSPLVVPTLDARVLAMLMLCFGLLGMIAMRRRVG